MINGKTEIYGIIGNPVEHSMSPLIHNSAFQNLKMNKVYTAFKVENVEDAIKGIRALNIKGCSVTIPHKRTVIEYLDEIDPIAKKIGAVNTILNKDGVLYGMNSDGSGAYRALIENNVKLDNANVLIIGSGGAARAIAFTIAEKSRINKLVLLGINEKEYTSLANEIKEKTDKNVIGLNIREMENEVNEASLLINTSPIGMHPNVDDSPFPKNFLNPRLAVFDIVYNPVRTTLLKDARKSGCNVIPGTEMFLNQAIIQFELWTGEKAPLEIMKKVLFEELIVE